MKVQISGAELNTEEKEMINRLLESYSRAEDTQHIEINIKKYDESGGGDRRVKFAINMHTHTNFGAFSAEGVDWLLNLALKEALRKLEKQVNHAIGKGAE